MSEFASPIQKVRVSTRDRQARIAVAIIFFVNGTIFSSWIPFIPLVKDKFALSEGQLGLMLLCITFGALIALPLTGWIISRTGSSKLIRFSALGDCIILPFMVFSPNIYLTMFALSIFGLCNGMIDVSMNSQAVEIEKRFGRPIMSSFHAMFSLGGLVGAGMASLMLGLGVTPIQYVGYISGLMLIIFIIAQFYFLPNKETIVPQSENEHKWTFPKGNLLFLGIIALLVLMSEGAMADWSAVYMMDVMKTDIAVAAIAYAAFSLTMTIVRFLGDFLTARLGPTLITRLGGAISASGLIIVVLSPWNWLVIIGFSLVGIGVANAVPVIFSAAGNTTKASPGVGIAAVSTAGYMGFLAGPPLIGFVAEISSLSISFLLLAIGFIAVVLMAKIVQKV